MLLSDFDGNTGWHTARLANWLLLTVGVGDSGSAVNRMALWFTGFLDRRPTSQSAILWHSLDELRVAVRGTGPNVSDQDLTDAITALPVAASQLWDSWSV